MRMHVLQEKKTMAGDKGMGSEMGGEGMGSEDKRADMPAQG